MTCIALRVDATASPLIPEVTAQLARIAQAITTQAVRDVAPVWGSAGTGVRAAAQGELPGAGEVLFAALDTLPDAPGAEAYHTETGGKPVLFDALDDAATLADFTTSVSHEVAETMGDPGVNREAIDYDTGYAYAIEICDPFEQNSYPIDLADGGPPVMVSDFALPSFYDAQGVAPFSYCEREGLPGVRVTAPFQPAAGGGYVSRRQITTSETEVDARQWHLLGTPSARRVRRMVAKTSRVSRRGAR